MGWQNICHAQHVLARRGVDLDHFLPPSPVLGLGKLVVCIYCPSVSWKIQPPRRSLSCCERSWCRTLLPFACTRRTRPERRKVPTSSASQERERERENTAEAEAEMGLVQTTTMLQAWKGKVRKKTKSSRVPSSYNGQRPPIPDSSLRLYRTVR